MNIEAIKLSFVTYISHFGMYDYIAYAWLILTFFIALLLSILLAKKSSILSILTLLFSLSILLAGPFVLKNILDERLRANTVEMTSVKKLHFTNVLIVDGTVQNLSKNIFSTCALHASVTKDSPNKVKQFIYKLKPLRKKSILLEKSLEPMQQEYFKIIFNNFASTDDINVSISAECY